MSKTKKSSKFLTAEELYNSIRQKIVSEEFLPGQALPTVRELSQKHSMSTGTISRIFQRLRQDGLLNSRQGSGAFVRAYTDSKAIEHKLTLLYFSKFTQPLSFDNAPFGWAILEGARDYCHRNNNSIIVKCSMPEKQHLIKTIDSLISCGKADGFIVLCPGEPELLPLLDVFEQKGVPFVLTDNPTPGPNQYNYVAGDNLQMGIKIADYLVSLGHRNILYVKTDTASCFDEQLMGFKITLKRHGLELTDNRIFHKIITLDYTEMEKSINQLYELFHQEKITAIHCDKDFFALTIAEYFQNQDIKIPEDVSISGGTGSELGAYYHPMLTTVTPGLRKMGATACEILVSLIETPQSTPIQKVMDVHVIPRESTAPCNS